MPKALIITEKPSVARDVVDALGGFRDQDGDFWESDQYLCTFAIGHLLELLEPEEIDPVYKRWVLDTLPILPEKFELKPKQGQTDRIRTIKKLINRPDVDTLINACDAGREGELIFREIVKFVGSTKPLLRLWLQSMTHASIRKGFQSLQDGKKYEGLGFAAECRSISDWLIGMNASRALTIRLRSRSNPGAWSAGRVQTPTLALLVDRELEVLAHVPKPYWRVLAQFAAADHQYQAIWYDAGFKADDEKPELKDDRIFDEDSAKTIVAETLGKVGVASETRKPSRESAPPLFDLTSLQRTANQRFGWSAARALQAAQRCYEAHKVLTYPRTDSRCLPSDYPAEVDRVLQSLSAAPEYRSSAQFLMHNGRQNESKIFNDAGISDHFAIIPTGQLANLAGDDQKLFDLVVRRFLGAFHPAAVWEQVERDTVVGKHHFSSRARTLREPGWRAVFDQDAAESDSNALPPLGPGLEKGESVTVQNQNAETEAEQTKPPPRITEGRLLSLMENAGKQIEDEEIAAALHEKGLGTPATRADIIENLKNKDYVDYTLRPTVKGMRLIDLLHRIHADRLASAELTGELELHLNEVEKGKRSAAQFLEEIADYTKDVVEKAKSFNYDDIYPNVDSLGTCPCEKQRPVYERSWLYRCEECPGEVNEAGEPIDCPFRIWKDKNGRYMDRQTVQILLRDKQTGELDGFRDRRGRTYKGSLALEEKTLVFKATAGSEGVPEGAEQKVFEVNPEPLGIDPLTNSPIIETPTEFISEVRKQKKEAGEKKIVGFVLPRQVCKREITRAEAIAYMESGSTPLIEDFISRFGRPFKAKLVRKEDGRHTFEFMPREGKAGGGGRGKGRGKFAGKKDATEENGVAETTKKGAKKAPAKKKAAAKKKTTAKKATKPKTKKADDSAPPNQSD